MAEQEDKGWLSSLKDIVMGGSEKKERSPEQKQKLKEALAKNEAKREGVEEVKPSEESKPVLKDALLGDVPESKEVEKKEPGTKTVPNAGQAHARKKLNGAFSLVASDPKLPRLNQDSGNPEPGRKSMVDVVTGAQKQFKEALGELDSGYTGKFEKLAAEIDKAIASKASLREKNAWFRIANKLTSSLMQFGAASYGQKHGINMAGTVVDTNDWDAVLRDNLANVDDQITGMKEKRGLLEKSRAEKLGTLKSNANQLLDASKQDLLGDERAADRLSREKIALAKASGKHPGTGKPLSAKESEDLGRLTGALDLLDKIKKDKMGDGTAEMPGVDTGFFNKTWNDFARFFGKGSPEMNNLREDLSDLLSNKVKTLSGAAASDKERKEILMTIPHAHQDDEQFVASLENTTKKLKFIHERVIDRLGKIGRDVSGLQPLTDEESFDWTAGQEKDRAKEGPQGARVRQNGIWYKWNGTDYEEEG